MGKCKVYYCSNCNEEYDIKFGFAIIEYNLYICDKCNHWENKEVKHPIKMEDEYCPNCNKPMKIITERNLDQLQCPKCLSILEWDGCFYNWD